MSLQVAAGTLTQLSMEVYSRGQTLAAVLPLNFAQPTQEGWVQARGSWPQELSTGPYWVRLLASGPHGRAVSEPTVLYHFAR
jgi:hypothetical protein